MSIRHPSRSRLDDERPDRVQRLDWTKDGSSARPAGWIGREGHPDASQDCPGSTRGLPMGRGSRSRSSRTVAAIVPSGSMNADGSDPVRVAAAENVSVPSWSPDGTTIAYTARVEGRTEIRSRLQRTERTIASCTPRAPRDLRRVRPSSPPTARRSCSTAGTDSGFDIFIMEVDGTDVRPTHDHGNDYDPHWSPDGTQIAFTRQETVDGRRSVESDLGHLRHGRGRDRRSTGSPMAARTRRTCTRNGHRMPRSRLPREHHRRAGLRSSSTERRRLRPAVLAEGEVLGDPHGSRCRPTDSPVAADRRPRVRRRAMSARTSGSASRSASANGSAADRLREMAERRRVDRRPSRRTTGPARGIRTPERFIVAVDFTGDRVVDSWVELDYGCHSGCARVGRDGRRRRRHRRAARRRTCVLDRRTTSFFEVRPGRSGGAPRWQPILVRRSGTRAGGDRRPVSRSSGSRGATQGTRSAIACEPSRRRPSDRLGRGATTSRERRSPYEVTETWFELRRRAELHVVVDASDFTVPMRIVSARIHSETGGVRRRPRYP